jgi:hypothetical protein
LQFGTGSFRRKTSQLAAHRKMALYLAHVLADSGSRRSADRAAVIEIQLL